MHFCDINGHVSSLYLRSARPHHDFWPTSLEGEGAQLEGIYMPPTPKESRFVSHFTPQQPAVPSPPPEQPTMANFVVDPRPHVPSGFQLEDPPIRPPLCHEVFVTGCYTLYNEDLVIVRL